jgi:hypothetical protein
MELLASYHPSYLSFSDFPVVPVVVLNWDTIKELFQKLKSRKRNRKRLNNDAIGFTLIEAVGDKNSPAVLGIINKKTHEVIDGVKIEAESIAPEVLQKHQESKGSLALYVREYKIVLYD